MAELWAEGENPDNYGFRDAGKALENMQSFIVSHKMQYKDNLRAFWSYTRKRAIENKKLIYKTQYYKQFKWVLKSDFEHPETLQFPLSYTIRGRLAKFRFYQLLHRIKTRLAGEER